MSEHWLPAVVMMLGWGLRGFIGGGPFGAMIPGALVVLALALRHRRRDVAVLAAFGAIGVGFGGEMTYGQTVGFIVKAETFWWGLLGLALKGAIWGLLAGAVIGLGLRPLPRHVIPGALVLVAATAAGWKLVNEPKLIYFSNRLDRPRPEIWAGFLLAGIALVGWLSWRGIGQPARRLAIAGFVGGGIGFGGGGAIQGLGRIFLPDWTFMHWWKYMEFFFGFCFGWALSWAFSHSELPADEPPPARPPWPLEIGVAWAVAAGLFYFSWHAPLRYAYLVAGAAVLVLISYWRWLAPHMAFSVTFAAVCLDSARYWSREYKRGAPEPAYALAAVAIAGFAWIVYRWRDRPARDLLNLLMWACVADAVFKFAIHPRGWIGVTDQISVAFVLMAAWASYRAAAMPSR